MGSDNISLIANTYYKGNQSSSKEFTIVQSNKNYLFILFIILTVILLICYYQQSSNVYWLSTLYLILALLFVLFAILTVLFSVKHERVILVVPIAMQLKTTYLSGRETISSIPWHLLGNLMILDIIVGQQVLFFLAVEVKISNSSKHVILFRHTKPRLKYLERIYRDFQEILDVNR
ncbi:hypothetical protein O3M35_003680 [Rhynocoris fuscipes]|uniref:Phosphatidylinositol N-acetylglucosaminyltransferase subunit H conserved domain-containing protein n=1 Tax=Rhynocoris fuscipes TaxID=488301 RepID=A0AAW1CL97_9HEMI